MNFRKLIEEICIEENIKYNLISKEWIMVLEKDDKIRYIAGYKFDLNNHGIGNICDDKYAFYDLCKLKNIPIIEHEILFNPTTSFGKNTIDKMHKFFDKYKDVVIKINDGSEGKDIYHITNKKDLDKITNDLFASNFSLSICPFYNYNSEYRVIILDNEVKLIFEKNKPTVIGDGIHSIYELLMQINPKYYEKNYNHLYDRVLDKNEVFEADWRFNLNKGATAKLVTNRRLYNKLGSIAKDVCKSLNLLFASVDIIDYKGKFILMEANSGVCINLVCNFIDKDKVLAKAIYKEAILKMFSNEN